MEINRAKERYCPCCSKVKDKTKFYPNPIKSGEYLAYCRECTSIKFRTAEANIDSKWAALWCICMEMGVPLFKDKFEALKNQYESYSGSGRRPEPFSMYVAMLKDAQVQYKGIFESDMQLSDFVDLNIEQDDGEISQKDLDAQRKEWDRIWGELYDNSDCQRLDEYFDGYTSEIPDMDVGMVLRYRDLCKAELRKFKGDDEKGQTTKEIADLMKMLKISDFSNAADKSDSKIAFEKFIAMIEQNKPAECEALDEYIDMCGHEKDRAEDMRCLQNAIAGTRDYPDVPRDER